ncbi:MAG: fibronectin type III domain-containing protein, partial [Acidobacteriota bacterium]|nr:fibronectin type III domain-containing protein [Acidobacteriota bacterium]
TLEIVLIDIDLAGTGNVSVTASSDTEPGGENVVLIESNPGSGLFRGMIPSSTQAPLPDGTLQVTDGDSILVQYVDLDDGMGGMNVVQSHTAMMDCVPPTIFGVSAEGITGDEATVSWTVDQPSTSLVTYDPVTPPATTKGDAVNVLDHSIDLEGLSQCTVYYYSVGSTDPAGNQGLDDNGGAYFHFETLGDFGAGLQPCHQGRVSFDVPTVGCSASLPVTVGDQDLNLDIAAIDTVVVSLTSTSEPNPESIVLTETAPNSSIFSASMPTAPAPAVSADGVLQVKDGDLLTVAYRDDDDGTGRPVTAFDTSVADCVGPQGIQVEVRDITDKDAVIEWTSATETTGHIEWGPSPALGNIAAAGAPATIHAVSIGTFPACGRVFFRVHTTDAAGNSSVVDAGGQPFAFDAFTLNGIVHADGFESDLGWTLEGEWEIGAPQGLGTAPGDPATALEGTQVLGHDLSGQGAAPGDYELIRTRSAISPVLDLSSLSAIELRFDRWLNVENTATSSVDVRDGGGSWQTVWSTTSASDTSWSEQVFDISTHAAGNAAFQVRFLQFSRFRSAAGWNVDRLFVRDGSLPTWDSCVACSGAPTFAGAVGAIDDDPCADSGMTVTWSEAPAWGTGLDGSYAIYRDVSSGFTPGPANLVAAGIAGSSWTDPSPPPDVPLYYVVRAENDESCGSGPDNGGLVDGNSIEVSAINETSQPSSANVGNTLHLDSLNDVHVRLEWAAAAGAASYRVYRSTTPNSGSTTIGSPPAPLYEDSGALLGNGIAYYHVVAADACGNESAE